MPATQHQNRHIRRRQGALAHKRAEHEDLSVTYQEVLDKYGIDPTRQEDFKEKMEALSDHDYERAMTASFFALLQLGPQKLGHLMMTWKYPSVS